MRPSLGPQIKEIAREPLAHKRPAIRWIMVAIQFRELSIANGLTCSTQPDERG